VLILNAVLSSSGPSEGVPHERVRSLPKPDGEEGSYAAKPGITKKRIHPGDRERSSWENGIIEHGTLK